MLNVTTQSDQLLALMPEVVRERLKSETYVSVVHFMSVCSALSEHLSSIALPPRGIEDLNQALKDIVSPMILCFHALLICSVS